MARKKKFRDYKLKATPTVLLPTLFICFCIEQTLSPLPNRDSNDKEVRCWIWKVYLNVLGFGYIPLLEKCESIKCFIVGYGFFPPFIYFYMKFSKQPSSGS